VKNGKLPIGDALALVPALAKDPDAEVVRGALFLVSAVRESYLPEAMRPKLARFISAAFGPKAKALGFRPKASDSPDDRRLRGDLVPFVAIYGDDKALLDEAKKLALKWLDDPGSLEDDATFGVMRAAGARGDRALFDRLRAELKKAKDARRAERIRDALASFREPALLTEALSLVLSEEVSILDSLEMLYQDPEKQGVVLEFLKKNIDAVMARVPSELRSSVLNTLDGICDERGRAEVEALFKDRAASVVGGPRRLSQGLEGISLCIAQGETMRPSLTSFFERK
jgi:alanyl aminopeptidase